MRHRPLTAVILLASGIPVAAFASNGPISSGDGVRLFSTDLNGLKAQSIVDTFGSSIFNDGADRTDHWGNYFTSVNGTGLSDQHGVFPTGTTGGVTPGAAFALSAAAGGPSGILRAATRAIAGSTADAPADATTYAKSTLGDRLTLANPATITLSGHFDGSVLATAGPEIATAAVQLQIYLVDRNDPQRNESGYLALAGYTFDLNGSATPNLRQDVSEAISVPVTLPAGSYFLYAHLETTSIVETNNTSAMAMSDFGHTFNFALVAPDGAGLTSQLGTVPIVNAIPEPGMLGVVAPAALFGLRRRR